MSFEMIFEETDLHGHFGVVKVYAEYVALSTDLLSN